MRLSPEQAHRVSHTARRIVEWAANRDDYANRWFEDEVGRLYIRVGFRNVGHRRLQVLEFANLEISRNYRHRGAMSAIMSASLDLPAPFAGLYIEGLDIRRNARWYRSLLETGWIEASRPSRDMWFDAGLSDLGDLSRSLGLPFDASDAYRRHVSPSMIEAGSTA